MSPEVLYGMTVGLLADDGVVSPGEREMLERLERALALAPGRAAAIEQAMRAPAVRRRVAGEGVAHRQALVRLLSAVVSPQACLSPVETRVIRRLAADAGVPQGELVELLQRAMAEAIARRAPAASAPAAGTPGAAAANEGTDRRRALARTIFTNLVLTMYVDLRPGPEERTLLDDYAGRLGLSVGEAEELVRSVKRGERTGFEIPEGRVERRMLYQAVRAMVLVDGKVTPGERRLLSELAKAAGFPEEFTQAP